MQLPTSIYDSERNITLAFDTFCNMQLSIMSCFLLINKQKMFMLQDFALSPWKGLMWIYKNSAIKWLLSAMSVGPAF